MKALLRDKQIYWPHFRKGIYFCLVGAAISYFSRPIGFSMIGYGAIMWSLAEILMGGDEVSELE